MTNEHQARDWWLVVLQKQGLAVLLILAITGYSMYYVIPNIGSFTKEVWLWHKEAVDKVIENSQIQAEAISNFPAAIDRNTQAFRELKETKEKDTFYLENISSGIEKLNKKLDSIDSVIISPEHKDVTRN